METIDHTLLKELTETRAESCISLYIPTYRVHPANDGDSLRFKNLFNDTLQYIRSHELSGHEKVLLPLQKLINDKEFWDHGTEGLAIFISENQHKIIRLPQSVEEASYVSDSFYITPLFKLYQENQDYYVLALGLSNVNLYRGNRHHIEQVPIEGKLPTSMKEALGHELTDNHLHGSVVEGAGLHGYMEKSQEEDIDMERFFRKIDKGLMEQFPIPQQIPILLAALPEHHTPFLRVSKHTNFAPLHIQINPQTLDKNDLLQKAGEVFDQILQQRKDELRDRYHIAVQEGLSSCDLGDVARAALDRRVDTLFLENNRKIAGYIDHDERRVEYSQSSETEILNEIASLVFEAGGNVMVLDKADMPVEAAACTLNRF